MHLQQSMENTQPNRILFYNLNEPYAEFMNTYPSLFKENDFVYKSNEHYFQSKKFLGTPKELYII